MKKNEIVKKDYELSKNEKNKSTNSLNYKKMELDKHIYCEFMFKKQKSARYPYNVNNTEFIKIFSAYLKTFCYIIKLIFIN
jgi:hypothetical protein